MHENIRRFYLDGEVKYEFLSKIRDTFQKTLEDQMREDGYVPVLDMDPQLTQQFNAKTGNFKVAMSVYGAHIGEDAWLVSGIMGGKKIPKHTQNPKLKAS